MPELTPVKPFRYTPPTIENTPCFIINLDTDKEKLAATKAVVNSIGFTTERFPAILGSSLDLSAIKEVTNYARKFLEPATIGIFMSHLSLWRKIAVSEAEHALVVEDDLYLDLPIDYVKRYISAALQELPEGWDVLYLGHFGLSGSPTEVSTLLSTVVWSNPSMPKREYTRISKRLNTPAFPLGAHAYMVSQKGCRKLLETCGIINTHVDLTMARAYSKGVWRVYALERRLLQQYSIQTGKITGGKFYGYIPDFFNTGIPLSHEPDFASSLKFSSGTFFNWKALSLLTGIIAVTAVLIGAVSVRVDYVLVGCFFLLLNSLDFIEGFSLSTTTIVLANTAVCIVCGFIGRIIVNKGDRY